MSSSPKNNKNSTSSKTQKSKKKTPVDAEVSSDGDDPFNDGEISSERFGRYRIVEPLATGGMAQIYKAETANHRFFTLKKILRNYSNNPEFIKMFLEEAKISLSLKHASVIRVLDFGQVEGHYYLAMEYVFGRDIGNILKTCAEKRIYIPFEVAVQLIHQCARGLDYAHNLTDSFGNKMGLIHRDISPPNVLVSYNGEVKLLDFGIAKAARAATTRRNTRSGVLKGKFSYMSPEQAMGEPLNEQSDVFSLGIVLWELLTSRSLFFSEDEFETLERVRAADVQAPSKIRKDIPPQLEAIVMKALTLKRKNRYQNAWEIAEDLKIFLKEFYPRSDNRTIARFMRTCFTEDYLRRQKSALQEGWQDVLQVGGADEDLLLDRGVERTITKSRVPDHEITWHQRLLYDPKVQGRLWATSLKAGGMLAAAALIFLIALPAGRVLIRNLTFKSQRAVVEAFGIDSAPKEETSEAGSAAENAQPEGNFANLIVRAEAAEKQRDYRTALEDYSHALEINAFEPKVLVRKHFMMLAEGQYVEPCAWFQGQKTVEAADRLLAEGICLEMDGQIPKAFTSYSDFLRRFPEDARADDVKLVIELLKGRWR